jgi:hypothetical protein
MTTSKSWRPAGLQYVARNDTLGGRSGRGEFEKETRRPTLTSKPELHQTGKQGFEAVESFPVRGLNRRRVSQFPLW